MKMLVDDENEGFVKFMGERITLFCANYIYTGKLIGVNATNIKLSDASVVYETGAFNDTNWKNAQELPNDWYVQTALIESWGKLK